jgi:hypothetical protein
MKYVFDLPLRASALLVPVLLAACGGGDDALPAPEETRAQDTRTFTTNALTSYSDYEAGADGQASFTAATGQAGSSRWAGELDGAAYRVEVPQNWNGELVMYAHGFRGNIPALTVSNPGIRAYLLSKGYAWAASSYSANYYDVRAGLEDTNELVAAFTTIAASRGRPLATPAKVFITGHSMGGHVAAAAVEAEALATANTKVRYAGAAPMCGVTGDTELFDAFTAMQATAQAVAGVPAYPLERWSEISALVNATLWTTAPGAGTPVVPTATGEKYVSIVKNLTGGERPLFRLALQRGGAFASAYGTFGGDGTITGILNRKVTDTTRYTYAIDGDPAASTAINSVTLKVTPEADANRLRRDGLRWIPKVNGQFSVPVVAIHTIGDLFVPFNMIQVYRQRAEAAGNGGRLVTRAIRGISHCDFTVSEQAETFDALVEWEKGGPKPAGDDVLTPAVLASTTYGCTFTRAAVPVTDLGTTVALRGLIAATPGGTCPP